VISVKWLYILGNIKLFIQATTISNRFRNFSFITESGKEKWAMNVMSKTPNVITKKNIPVMAMLIET
jgi:hypothetical protein